MNNASDMPSAISPATNIGVWSRNSVNMVLASNAVLDCVAEKRDRRRLCSRVTVVSNLARASGSRENDARMAGAVKSRRAP